MKTKWAPSRAQTIVREMPEHFFIYLFCSPFLKGGPDLQDALDGVDASQQVEASAEDAQHAGHDARQGRRLQHLRRRWKKEAKKTKRQFVRSALTEEVGGKGNAATPRRCRASRGNVAACKKKKKKKRREEPAAALSGSDGPQTGSL